MKILKSLNPDPILTPEALSASLPKFTVIQNLNHVILIFQDITEFIPNPIDVNSLNTFTAKYIEFRQSTLNSPPFHTSVKFLAADNRLNAKGPSPDNLQPKASCLQSSPIDLPLFERSFPVDPQKTKRITRKILRDSLPSLSVTEKLNLVVTIFDYITTDEQDFIRLKEIISGYVRFHKKCIAKKLKEGTN
jgi:hypothetical protein